MARIENVEITDSGITVTAAPSEDNDPDHLAAHILIETQPGNLQLPDRVAPVRNGSATIEFPAGVLRRAVSDSDLFAFEEFSDYEFLLSVIPKNREGDALLDYVAREYISLPRAIFTARDDGGGRGPAPHDPDAEVDARVYINGTRIPIADVDLYIRKEGPLDLSRYLECEFASPFRGEDYASLFAATSPNDQQEWDIARVELKEHATDEFYLAFKGLVTGVGNAAEGPEQLWQFRSQGPAFFLDRIPASKSFAGAQAKDVLGYVADELQKRVPFAVETDVRDREDVRNYTVGEQLSFGVPIIGAIAKFTDMLSTPKTFQSNKHTLADVITWLSRKTETFVWLEPTENGVGFVATDQPTQRKHSAYNLGGDVYVVNNDALSELRPVNTLVGKGSAKRSLQIFGDFEINAPGDDYIAAKARHRDLYRRAGKRELHADTEFLSDAQSSQEVESATKKRLKDEINEATAGDMQALLTPQIRPYETVEALPVCNGVTNEDVQPITYEVDRVRHQIRSGMSMTELNVGVHAALDDIQIIKNWESDA